MTHQPLVAVFSQHHPMGVLPPRLLVEAAADAGHKVLALTDLATLRGAPSFLRACQEIGVHPLLGMTLSVSMEPRSGPTRNQDVFDLLPSVRTREARSSHEWVTLLALTQQGFDTLVKLEQQVRSSPTLSVPLELLGSVSEGLHLILGPPGSILDRVVSGRRPWRTALFLEPLFTLFPSSQTSFGGLYTSSDEFELARRVKSLEKLPHRVSTLAVHWVSYRDDRDRFWGLAKASLEKRHPPYEIGGTMTLENSWVIQNRLQGLSGALSRVTKIVSKHSNRFNTYRSLPPVYPSPRGTDTDTFFWTLVQEIAISTGHIQRPEYKQRLYEEFQFYKQTDWPTLLLLLWDLRRRVGLPPGTLSPAGSWPIASLFVHILGLSRVDPVRAGLPFESPPVKFPQEESLTLEIECPPGWESQIHDAAAELLGASKVVRCRRAEALDSGDLMRAANRILDRWEEHEFADNRPHTLPPIPVHLVRKDPAPAHRCSIHLSGRTLGFVPADRDRTYSLILDPKDQALLGGLNLNLITKSPLALASAPRYRRVDFAEISPQTNLESVTDWIERHEGKVFFGKPYADDTGHFEVLSISPSLLRLLTLPDTIGYRPLLWKWFLEAPPQTLVDLADYLALAYHWTFWSGRPRYRKRAYGLPFASETASPPPWWEEWGRFVEQWSLDSHLASRVSTQLEKETESTGGWLLYQESLVRAMAEALKWPTEKVGEFLVEKKNRSPSNSLSDFAPFSPEQRRGFLDFLGYPNPLPERKLFLKKAAEILAACDAFDSDPVAWVVLAASLYPQEQAERKTVYRILKDRGYRLDFPRRTNGAVCPRSDRTDRLVLGLTDLVGVGEKFASTLSAHPDRMRIQDLFRNDPGSTKEPFHFPTWLKKRERILPQTVVENLIRLGYFDSDLPDREKLLDRTRTRYDRRRQDSSSYQLTLFGPLETESPSLERETEPARIDEKGQLECEISDLRIPISGTPLEKYGNSVPAHWKRERQDPSISGLHVGWVYDFEVFSRPPETMSGTASPQSPPFIVTFLFHTGQGTWVVTDEDGLTAGLLTDSEIPEPRLDGQRFHLQQPACLLVELAAKASRNRPWVPASRLIAAESVEDVLHRKREWQSIRIELEKKVSPNPPDLEDLVAWFVVEDDEGDLPRIETHEKRTSNPLDLVRRKRGRFASRPVLPSRILVERLRQIPGVLRVEVIPRTEPLFTGPENGDP